MEAAVLSFSLLLAACGESAEKSLALCRLEAFKVFGDKYNSNDKTKKFLTVCMEPKGYHFKHAISFCMGPGSPTIVECYETGLERWWLKTIGKQS